ncbi:LOW QUALITY PROTEIN: major facilitator superfamily domain-containing protein [Jimgerdemannia flammicorona]|uniref:Major facilitator superfamily domain-containing protein n=1 Tax=Jimgerdemannia flammicorona TaxID=994334 RepID=A0A433Q3N1_9FUNG|nr:LOW QUALITY PROTEIN: major facilitator superfamily domain-containing protein [Jimgerdemannia flammicorona]
MGDDKQEIAALEYVKTDEEFASEEGFDPDEERKLLWKLDKRLTPFLTLLYLLSFLDRVNIGSMDVHFSLTPGTFRNHAITTTQSKLNHGRNNNVAWHVKAMRHCRFRSLTRKFCRSGNAELAHLDSDLKLTNDEYNWALSIFFIGYVILEVPSNVFLKRFGPRLWIPIGMTVWGGIMIAMAAVQNSAGLLSARVRFRESRTMCASATIFFLGLAEAGLVPGIVYYLSLWYTRKEQAVRNAAFFSAATLAGAFGGVLAYGILQMAGTQGLTGWQWIFILEGLPTVVLAFVTYIYLPDLPETASFLTDDERDLLKRRLAQDAGMAKETHFSWKQFFDAFRDWKVYLHMAIFICMATPLYSLSLFLPSIIREMGYTALTAQLMSAPLYAVACFFSILLAFTSDHFRERGLHVAIPATVAMVGYILMIILKDSGSQALYGAATLTATGIFSKTPAMFSWFANNIGGHTKRGVAIAAIIAFGNIGGAIGGQIYRADDTQFGEISWIDRFMPYDNPYLIADLPSIARTVRGHTICAVILAFGIVFILLMKFLLIRENRRRDNLTPEQFAKEAEGEELADWHPSFRYIT